MLNCVDDSITPSDRQQLLDVLAASEARFRHAIHGLTEAQWEQKPAPGKWSPAELAEHLALSEEVVPRLDGYQWLLMLAHHSDRHVRQIERALGSPAAAEEST